MFLSFKRKANKTELNPIVVKTISRVVHMQRKIALYLQAKSNYLTDKVKYALLVSFILLAGMASLYIFISGLVESDSWSLPRSQITKPIYINKPGNSREITKSGRRVYDSVVFMRPGLLDSLRQLEALFNQQKNMKWKRKHTP